MNFSDRFPGDDPGALRSAGHTAWARLPYAVRLLTWYWGSRHARVSWAMVAVLVVALFGGVRALIWLNLWERDFFDALSNKDLQRFGRLTISWFGIYAVVLLAGLTREGLELLVGFRWRDWMTRRYIDKWLHRLAYYRIERHDRVDNPDQRIAQDLAQLATVGLNLALSSLQFVTSTVSFGIVLWGLSGSISVPVGGQDVQVAGYLVWAAIAYALLGSWFVTLFGRRLIPTTVRQEGFEADFRYLLIHVRRGAEQLALYRGEASERARLAAAFGSIRRNFNLKVWLQIRLAAAQQTYVQLDQIIPILLVGPRYFAGAISLGMVVQTRGAFIAFGGALSWFATVYPRILQLRATMVRIAALEAEMNLPPAAGIERTHAAGHGVSARGLALRLPEGRPLVAIGDFRIEAGERWLVRGPSGVGKSSLLRAIAGLWTTGAGSLEVPADAVSMFIPQQPYFPVGSLKEALAFPRGAAAVTDAACIDILERCRLSQLSHRLADQTTWDRELSGGEQQRLAFGRAMLLAPRVLFLDEATSALDADNERHMYTELLAALPGLTLVSIAHREALAVHHSHALDLRPGHGPALNGRLPT